VKNSKYGLCLFYFTSVSVSMLPITKALVKTYKHLRREFTTSDEVVNDCVVAIACRIGYYNKLCSQE